MFEAGRVDTAYTQYRLVREQQEQQSMRQLLRMAYVQEGLGHYPAALYYLSVAQVGSPRHATWRKMVALAQAHRLTGYPDTWRQSLAITFQRYYHRLLQVLLAGAVVGGTLLLARRKTAGQVWWSLYGVYLLSVVVFLNVLAPARIGLVARTHAALMTGPSAGAAWLTTAAAGDRFVVLGQQDIWYRVKWKGQDAYIRRPDLLLVQ